MSKIRTAIAAAALAATAATTFAVAGSTSAHPSDPQTNVYFAVVGLDGQFPYLAREQGVMGVTSAPYPEQATVLFERDVSHCAFNATVGSPGTSLVDPGYATVRTSPQSKSVVRVATYHATGTPQPMPFHLQVICHDTVWADVPFFIPSDDDDRG